MISIQEFTEARSRKAVSVVEIYEGRNLIAMQYTAIALQYSFVGFQFRGFLVCCRVCVAVKCNCIDVRCQLARAQPKQSHGVEAAISLWSETLVRLVPFPCHAFHSTNIETNKTSRSDRTCHWKCFNRTPESTRWTRARLTLTQLH